MKIILLIFLAMLSGLTFGQLAPIGQFDHHQDVGNPRKAGSATYNANDQTYTISGAGINMWTKTDQFHFLWKKINERINFLQE